MRLVRVVERLPRSHGVAGAFDVVDDGGAVVLGEANGGLGVLHGVYGVGEDALGGLHCVLGVDFGGGAQCRYVGQRDAEVEGELGGACGGGEGANFDVGVDLDLVRVYYDDFGVFDVEVVEAALEGEQGAVFLGGKVLVKGGVYDGVGKGGGRCHGVVYGARWLGAGAMDELECVDVKVVADRVGGVKGVVAGDLVGVGEELARQVRVDAAEEEHEGGNVLDVDAPVDGVGGAAGGVGCVSEDAKLCAWCVWRVRCVWRVKMRSWAPK